MKIVRNLAFVLVLNAAALVSAQEPLVGGMSRTGFFAGIGGSYNSVTLNQNMYVAGTSSIDINGVNVANGDAAGPTNPFNSTNQTFAPAVDVGYWLDTQFENWLCGGKFSYKYLDLNFEQRNVESPQDGTLTPTNANVPGNTFTGVAFVQSTQTMVNHQLTLMPLLGRKFRNGQFYFGGGPVVFQTDQRIYRAIGFADLNGTRTSITQSPANFSSSTWMWGGGAQVGVIYNLTPMWFINASYECVATGTYTKNYQSGFSSTSNGYSDSGVIYVTTNQNIFAQSITCTINRLF